MNKWAIFSRVNGVWRFDGFTEEADISHEKMCCERDNGPGSFRATLFVDETDVATKNKGSAQHDLTRDVL